jgi:hypothetical protein
MTAPTEDLIERLEVFAEDWHMYPAHVALSTEAAQALRSLQAEVERLRVLVGDMQPMAICWATHYATGRGFERHPTHANILDRARSALNTGSGEG